MSIKTWPLINEKAAYKTPIFTVRENVSLSPKDGGEKTLYTIHSQDWAQVVPVTDNGQVIMVRQYRHGTRSISLELPGGVIEEGQTPLEAAQRELLEETGYAAAQWSSLAVLRPNPAIFDNTAHVFVAEGAHLHGSTNFDENEDLELVTVPVDQLKNLIEEGTVDHAIMVAAIALFLMRYVK